MPRHNQSSNRESHASKQSNARARVRVLRQLDTLVKQLGLTEPHYIKCIKPNSAKSPGGWSSPLVTDQLRYSGVLEVSENASFLESKQHWSVCVDSPTTRCA